MTIFEPRPQYLGAYSLEDTKETFKRIKGAAAGIGNGRIHEMLGNVLSADGLGTRGNMDEDYIFCEHLKVHLASAYGSLPEVIATTWNLAHLLAGDTQIQDAYMALDEDLKKLDLDREYILEEQESWPPEMRAYILAAAVACQAVMERLVANTYEKEGVKGPINFPVTDD